jgi:hypothetical protein
LVASAQRLALPGGGVAFYEPAEDGFGRRLAIHAADTDLYIESNMTLPAMLSIASSLPVHGEGLPRRWRVQSSQGLTVERISPRMALSIAGMAGYPSLPDGYLVASAQRLVVHGTSAGVTIIFREGETDAVGSPISLHVDDSGVLPPASSSEQSILRVGAVNGRWTPGRSLLEWVDQGRYWSLHGEVDVRTLLSIASSLTHDLV